ncbi:hypothetical protein JL720_15663 [Aureococcus anophagefferens]|nr:hypothetical protein JL720_15663 [Aureococcus anophagefferens]
MVVPRDAAEAEKWRVVLDFEQSMADMREAMRASKVEVDAAVDEGRRKGEDERRELREAQALVREYRAQERELGEMRAQLLGSCEDVRRQCADAKSSLEIAEGTLADCDDPEKKAKADEWARVLETQPLDVASKARLERLEKLACDVASTLSDVKLVNEHREKLEASLPKATVSSFFTSPRRKSRGPGVLGDATNDSPKPSAAPLLIRRIKATYEASLRVTEVTLPDLDRRLKLALEEKRELERRIERSREDASPESAAAGSYFSPGGDEPKALADAPFASSHEHDEEAQLQRNLAALFSQPFKTVVRDFRPHVVGVVGAKPPNWRDRAPPPGSDGPLPAVVDESLRGAEHCVWSAKRLDKARREAEAAARDAATPEGAPAAAPSPKPPAKGRPLEPDAARGARARAAPPPAPAAPAPAPAFGAAPPAPPPAATDYKARIVALYARTPDKVGNVDALLASTGREAELAAKIEAKYSKAPAPAAFGAAASPRRPAAPPGAPARPGGGAAAPAPATPFGTAPAPAQPTSMFTPSKGAGSGGLFAPGRAGGGGAAAPAPSAGVGRRRGAPAFGGGAAGGATFGAAAAQSSFGQPAAGGFGAQPSAFGAQPSAFGAAPSGFGASAPSSSFTQFRG